MATKPSETTTSLVHYMCPRYEQAIQLLGKRWTGLILDTLMSGPQRFCELTSIVEGLSDRVLSDRLQRTTEQYVALVPEQRATAR